MKHTNPQEMLFGVNRRKYSCEIGDEGLLT